MTTTTPSNLDYALRYRALGWKVFPLRPGTKAPMTPNGFLDASAAEQQIRDWFAQEPRAGIGWAIPNDMVVIDVDVHGIPTDRQAGIARQRLEQLGKLPPTLMARTGGGGFHLVFRRPNGATITGKRFETLEGIDYKVGGNGYIVVAPSRHPDGGVYRWVDEDMPIADLPDHVVRLMQAQPTDQQNGQQTGERRAHWDEEPIPEGQRADALIRVAGSLRGKGLTADEMLPVLLSFNQRRCDPPLPEDEVKKIAHSYGKYPPGTPAENRPAVEPPTTEPQDNSQPWQQVKSLADRTPDDFPPIKWAVPDLLPSGLTLLAGAPKVGKSFLALQLVIAVAQGTAALGRLACEQGRALYLALEDSERRLVSRRHDLLQGNPLRGVADFSVEWPPLDRGGKEQLTAYLAAHPDTRLVVIDTLAMVRPTSRGSNGPGYTEDYAAIKDLRRIAQEFDVAILVVHHTNKTKSDDIQDKVSGTTGLTGAADSTMALLDGGDGRAVLKLLGRDVERQEYVLKRQPESPGWMLSSESAETMRLPKVQQEVLALLQASPTVTMGTGAISDELHQPTYMVTRLLQRMARDGVIYDRGYGKWSSSSEYVRDSSARRSRRTAKSANLQSLQTMQSLQTSGSERPGSDGKFAKFAPLQTTANSPAQADSRSAGEVCKFAKFALPTDDTTCIPAEDKDACPACGERVLEGGDYCTAHWPKHMPRPGCTLSEMTCGHLVHLEDAPNYHCTGCDGDWTPTTLPDGVTGRDEHGDFLTWDARRKQWTTQTTTQAN